MKKDVFFAPMPDASNEAKLKALEALIAAARPFAGYKSNELVPVKITLGDTKSVHHVDPESVRLIISVIKETKAKPFLFDTNVIYKGSRENAVDHLTLAQNKGFGHVKVGAPFIIADGLIGYDGKDVETGGQFIKKIKIPSFIGMLDNLVVISHVTGHILSGYAGAIKNVAMGMASKPTKQVEHSSIKPSVIFLKCVACGLCVKICPANAISIKMGKACVDQEKCVGCGECLCACKFSAIKVNWSEDNDVFVKRMVETAKTILSGFKNPFFINFACGITKECDCISDKSDKIISKDLGILASADPVSLDKATADLMTEQKDIFKDENLSQSYITMLKYAESFGLGSLDYTLRKI